MNAGSWRGTNRASSGNDSSIAPCIRDGCESAGNARHRLAGNRRDRIAGHRIVSRRAWRLGAACLEYEKACPVGAGSYVARRIWSTSAEICQRYARYSLCTCRQRARYALGDGGSGKGRIECRGRNRRGAKGSRFHGDAAAGDVFASSRCALPFGAYGTAGADRRGERGALALASGNAGERDSSTRPARAGQSEMVTRIAAGTQSPAGTVDRRTGGEPR